MIEMELAPILRTATKERSCEYVAMHDTPEGTHYQAVARMGASNALARVLVKYGFEDQPVVVHEQGHKGTLRWASLHEMAKWTYSDSPSTGLKRIPWVDPKLRFGRDTTAKDEGEEGEG